MSGAAVLLLLTGCALGALVARPATTAVEHYTIPLVSPSRVRVALVAVAAFAAVGAAAGPHWHLLALYWATACAVPLAFIDTAVHRLPRSLTYSSSVGTLALLAAAALLGDRSGSALRALGYGIGLWVVTFVAALVTSLGEGDATLAVTLGAVLGWYGFLTLFDGVFLGTLMAALYGTGKLVARRARRHDELPFGPFLLLGTLLAVALSS